MDVRERVPMRRRGMRTILVTVLLAASAVATTAVSTTSAGAGEASLASVRQATAAYHSVPAAELANYEPKLSCFSSSAGGMGQHLLNGELMDASLDAEHPEALVYEVKDNKLQLVAVEYIVPMTAWTAHVPPTVLGHDLHMLPSLGLWVLHAWVWRPNPAGMFADYNPSVPPCP